MMDVKSFNAQQTTSKHKFKSFHELMTRRIAEILLVSSTYDAYIMQEDGPLAERVINEYRGLNLSRPPRLTWISKGAKALEEISKGDFDLVIVMPHIGDMDSYDLCTRIKEIKSNLPVYFLAYDAGRILEEQQYIDRSSIDRILLWSGNTDLLLAIVKNQEDQINVELDTELAHIRVIIFVEDSPFYLSSLLPVLYRELVLQTQAVMDDSLNQKDRLLRMRTRPKILVAENYEQAWQLYERYKKYLFCVISDVRYEKEGKEDGKAGVALLSKIRSEQPDLPLLMLSTEPENRNAAEALPALFYDKSSPRLHKNLANFFSHSLGFGDFYFRLESGEIVASATNLRSMANVLKTIPAESFAHHARRNDFSRWLMARFEMEIAEKLRWVMLEDFHGVEDAREFLITILKNKLQKRQQGLVSDFSQNEYDPDMEFVKLGKGSLGGKARGLAFISNLLREKSNFDEQFETVDISLPKTLVISTEGFDLFAEVNSIYETFNAIQSDASIEETFLQTVFPDQLREDLMVFLEHTTYPLAIRSSAILEDAHYRASAGAYTTYMLPNNHEDINVRLERLIMAIKLIYSSIFKETPRILAKNSIYRQEEDKMAVIIQELVGQRTDDLYYPAISGVAQSYNFYPVSYMKPDDGVAHVALGLGRIVVDGGIALRFAPKYPQLLPQFSSVEDILRNAQRYFYALKLHNDLDTPLDNMMVKIDVDDACSHHPVRKLASTFTPEDQRLRDFYTGQGCPLITFASVLKFGEFPLGEIISRILEIGEKGMGCPVEIEFAVNLEEGKKPHFYLLQIRPMVVAHSRINIKLTETDLARAWCYSDKAMGQSKESEVHSIIYVKPESFDTAKTMEIAAEIEKINSAMRTMGKKYMLIGPGRWGTSDRWLGIPVKWNAITEAQSIMETTSEKLHADPSQGSHFFHNITSLGINYLGIPPKGESYIQMEYLDNKPAEMETDYLRYVEFNDPIILKIDGKNSRGVLLPGEPSAEE